MNLKNLKLLWAVLLLCATNISLAQQTSPLNDNPSLVKVNNRLDQLNSELKDLERHIEYVSSIPSLYEQLVNDGTWNKYQEVKVAKKAEIQEWENIRTSLVNNNAAPVEKTKITRQEFNALPPHKQQAVLNSGFYEIVD